MSPNSNWHKHSTTTPLGFYNYDDKVGEDDVFMVRLKTNFSEFYIIHNSFHYRHSICHLIHPNQNLIRKALAVIVSLYLFFLC